MNLNSEIYLIWPVGSLFLCFSNKEHLFVNFSGLNPGKATLSVFTNEQGGILDDFIATKTKENSLYLVSNASRKQSDMQTMLEAQVWLNEF